MTIATRLLSDEKGFLILDDPFVKADAERLGRMMDMLRSLVDDGWQILYFSAKEEVAQALADDVKQGRVRLVEIEAPAATAPATTQPAPEGDAEADADPDGETRGVDEPIRDEAVCTMAGGKEHGGVNEGAAAVDAGRGGAGGKSSVDGR